MSHKSFPGNDLKTEREKLGFSVDDVYKMLHISSGVISALEDSRLEDLPAETYAIGFIRSYCELLGLDPDRYADALRESRRPATNFLGMPSGEDRGSRPAWLSDLTAWAAIALLLVLGWLSYSMVVKPAEEETSGRVQAETVLFPGER